MTASLAATELLSASKGSRSLNLTRINRLTPTGLEFIQWGLQNQILSPAQIESIFLEDSEEQKVAPISNKEYLKELRESVSESFLCKES